VAIEAAAELIDGPLLRTVRDRPTEIWNDSCAVAELEWSIARGATGATSNPTIVGDVLKAEHDAWVPRIRDLAASNPTWTETELTWAVIEAMAVRGAALLEPVFRREGGRTGRLSIQTDPTLYRDAERMLEQGVRFAALGPNLQVKFPTTAAGIAAIEAATARGVRINATVCFTVPQALAVGEAVERGLDAYQASGGDVVMTIPRPWLARFDASGIEPESRIDVPVDEAFVDELLARIPDFRRAYEPDGLSIGEFDGYGATVRTLRAFIASYHELIAAVREVMLPDPDRRSA
jgi:transaldolase